MRRWVILVAVTITAVGTITCARQPLRGPAAPSLDRKLSTFAWIEEGDLATLIVGTRAGRYREDDPYVPLEICVANRGLRALTLSRESFVLVDAEGRRYPCAGPKELLEGYEFLDMDRRLAELQEIVFNRFAAFTRYPSQFSPTREGPATPRGSTIVRDVTTLPKFGYLIDYLYFPRPEAGVMGSKLELTMAAPELDNPIYVRFVIE